MNGISFLLIQSSAVIMLYTLQLKPLRVRNVHHQEQKERVPKKKKSFFFLSLKKKVLIYKNFALLSLLYNNNKAD
jgi:hypothetical protein